MPRRLITVAFPEVEPPVAGFLREYKTAHTPEARVSAPPHFTMVFPSSAIAEADYVAHVSAIAARAKPVPFVCRYAMLGADDEDERAYVFLVPDEGFSAISLLHDALYGGLFASQLRLDLPYVPHITVGVLADRRAAKALCHQLNVDGVNIVGRIAELTVSVIEDGGLHPLSVHRLGS